MQGLLNFSHTIKQKNVFFAAAGDARISAVDVRDLADVAVAALTTSQHENKIYSLTGPEELDVRAYGAAAIEVCRPLDWGGAPPPPLFMGSQQKSPLDRRQGRERHGNLQATLRIALTSVR